MQTIGIYTQNYSKNKGWCRLEKPGKAKKKKSNENLYPNKSVDSVSQGIILTTQISFSSSATCIVKERDSSEIVNCIFS